jgi:hypothetical protein
MAGSSTANFSILTLFEFDTTPTLIGGLTNQIYSGTNPCGFNMSQITHLTTATRYYGVRLFSSTANTAPSLAIAGSSNNAITFEFIKAG